MKKASILNIFNTLPAWRRGVLVLLPPVGWYALYVGASYLRTVQQTLTAEPPLVVSPEAGVMGLTWLMLAALALGSAFWLGLRPLFEQAGEYAEALPMEAPVAGAAAAPRANPWPRLLRGLSFPAVVGLALLGQVLLNHSQAGGVVFFGLSAVGLVLLFKFYALDRLNGAVVQLPLVAETPAALTLRWGWLVAAVVFSGLTFWWNGDNTLTPWGAAAWGLSLISWVIAFWEGPVIFQLNWRGVWEKLWQPRDGVRLTRLRLGLLGALAVAAVFCYAYLDTVPAEMTSDHVEKLLDVNDILQGRRPIFEQNNAGREALAFYVIALVAQYTGLNYLTLKLVSATFGFITLPFIFLFAREVTDDKLTGVLAALVAGIGWWHNSISRNGLRFPLSPLFAALALWLIVRALKRGRRNSALLAGLALGFGFYGYSPGRFVPAVITLALGLYALHLQRRAVKLKWLRWVAVAGAAILGVGFWLGLQPEVGDGLVQWVCLTGIGLLLAALGIYVWRAVNWEVGRRAALWLVLVGLVTFAVFVPLFRYATVDDPAMFSHRMLSRMLGDDYKNNPIAPTWHRMVANEWNSMRMFFWTYDVQWLVSPPDQPALDTVMAALLMLGLVWLGYRYWRYRQWADLFLVASIPVLLVPSTLALAFPGENPSLHRSSAALPVVYTVVALGLRLAVAYGRKMLGGRTGTVVGVGLAAGLVFVSAQLNWKIMFQDYQTAYLRSVPNDSERGNLIKFFVATGGVYENAFVYDHAYWMDMRSVGIYAGKFAPQWWQDQQVITRPEDLGRTLKPGNRMIILYLQEDPVVLAELSRLYPRGTLTTYHSARPEKDFLVFQMPPPTVYELEVQANQGWQAVGLNLPVSPTLRLTAQPGELVFGDVQLADAAGTADVCQTADCCEALPGAPRFGLLARVGDETVFVGQESTPTFNAGGELWLRFNSCDAALANSTGSLRVQVLQP